MPARIGRLSAGGARRASSHGVDKAGMRTAAPDRRAVECTRARVAVRKVVAPAPQPEPASRPRSEMRDISILRSDSRCRRYVSDRSSVTPKYLGSEQKDSISLLKFTFRSHLASLLLRWKAADTDFVVLSFSFQV